MIEGGLREGGLIGDGFLEGGLIGDGFLEGGLIEGGLIGWVDRGCRWVGWEYLVREFNSIHAADLLTR